MFGFLKKILNTMKKLSFIYCDKLEQHLDEAINTAQRLGIENKQLKENNDTLIDNNIKLTESENTKFKITINPLINIKPYLNKKSLDTCVAKLIKLSGDTGVSGKDSVAQFIINRLDEIGRAHV